MRNVTHSRKVRALGRVHSVLAGLRARLNYGYEKVFFVSCLPNEKEK